MQFVGGLKKMQSETSGQALKEGDQQIEQSQTVIGFREPRDTFDNPYDVFPGLHEVYSG